MVFKALCDLRDCLSRLISPAPLPPHFELLAVPLTCQAVLGLWASALAVPSACNASPALLCLPLSSSKSAQLPPLLRSLLGALLAPAWADLAHFPQPHLHCVHIYSSLSPVNLSSSGVGTVIISLQGCSSLSLQLPASPCLNQVFACIQKPTRINFSHTEGLVREHKEFLETDGQKTP